MQTDDKRRLMSVRQVATCIDHACESETGFSFIRMGDSEGAILAYDPATVNGDDTAYFAAHFGAAGIGDDTLGPLAGHLRNALQYADLVGQRDDVWFADRQADHLDPADPGFVKAFQHCLRLREPEKNIPPHATRRLYGLYKWMRSDEFPDCPICSSWVTFDLALEGYWEHLLSRFSGVTLIHCSPTLPDRLREVLRLDVRHIRIPDLQSHRNRWADDDLAEQIYPDSFNRVMAEMQTIEPGTLVLIGAGIPGKAYADAVKKRGAIGLDLGGLLDAWDGRPTRPLVFATKVPDVDPASGHEPFMLKPPKRLSGMRLFKRWVSRRIGRFVGS